MSSNIAVIPARGGSKRIPGKNIKDFLGLPILAYSISTALASGLFEVVMVSTDDEEIAEVAKRFGAEVPFIRSSKNSDDYATTVDVLNEVLSAYRSEKNKAFDFACCIYATAPLIKKDKIIEGYQVLVSENRESVFPVVAYGYPVWRGLQIENGKTQMIWKQYQSERSQDLKTVYHDAGQWYWFDARKTLTGLFTENSSSVILSEMEVQDIDTMNDWKLAELKFKLLNA